MRRPVNRENALHIFQRLQAIPVRLFPDSLHYCMHSTPGMLPRSTPRPSTVKMKDMHPDMHPSEEEGMMKETYGREGLGAGEVLVVSSGGHRRLGRCLREHSALMATCCSRKSGRIEKEVKNVREICSHDTQWMYRVAGYQVQCGGALFVIETPATTPFSMKRLEKWSSVQNVSSSTFREKVSNTNDADIPRSPSFCEREKGEGGRESGLGSSLQHSFPPSPPLSCCTRPTVEGEEQRQASGPFAQVQALDRWSHWEPFCATVFPSPVKDHKGKHTRRCALPQREAPGRGANCTRHRGEEHPAGTPEQVVVDEEGKDDGSSPSLPPHFDAISTPEAGVSVLSSLQKRKTSFHQYGEGQSVTHHSRLAPQSSTGTFLPPATPISSSSVERRTDTMRVSLLVVSIHMGYLLTYERFTGKEVPLIPPLVSLMSRIKNCALIILEQQGEERIEGKGEGRGVPLCDVGRTSAAAPPPLSPVVGRGSERHVFSCPLSRWSDEVEAAGVEDARRKRAACEVPGPPPPPVTASRSEPPPRASFLPLAFSSSESSISAISTSSCSSSILSRFLLFLQSSMAPADPVRMPRKHPPSPLLPSYRPATGGCPSAHWASALRGRTDERSGGRRPYRFSFLGNRMEGGWDTPQWSGTTITALWFLQLESYFTSPSCCQGRMGLPLLDGVPSSMSKDSFLSTHLLLPSRCPMQEGSATKEEGAPETRGGEACLEVSSLLLQHVEVIAAPITRGFLFRILSEGALQQRDNPSRAFGGNPLASFHRPDECGSSEESFSPIERGVKRKRSEEDEIFIVGQPPQDAAYSVSDTVRENGQGRIGLSLLRRPSGGPARPYRPNGMYAVCVGVLSDILQ